MMKFLSVALVLLLLFSGAAFAEPLPQEDYYGRYMAATTEEERQAVLDEMPDTRYAAYDAESMKWGLIDRVGRWVVEPRWDEASSFARGQYTLVAVFSESEELNYFIVDRNGEQVARLPDSFDDYTCNPFSDQLTVEMWDDGVELLFDANLGRFLNESGIVKGKAGIGYIFQCIDRYAEEYALGYPLNGEGLPYCDGLWFEPTMPYLLSPDNPDAKPMAEVYWNTEQWEIVTEYYPEIVEQYGGDLSWLSSRPEGYSLLDAEGNIVATSAESEFCLAEYPEELQRPADAIAQPSSAGVYWTFADEPDHIQLTDEQSNIYHTMYFDDFLLQHSRYFLAPYDDFFLVWDDSLDRNGEGFLRADGSVLYPTQFDYAIPFLDGLAYVEWFDSLPQWEWDETIQAHYDENCFASTPYWEASDQEPSFGCYIDAYGHIVYSCDGLPRTILTETTSHSTTKE
ncbi:MAG: WG repeat-containing protein [Clostridia bacterium]|nr:WG repeat-containing protein [Clostridia bacterium]